MACRPPPHVESEFSILRNSRSESVRGVNIRPPVASACDGGRNHPRRVSWPTRPRSRSRASSSIREIDRRDDEDDEDDEEDEDEEETNIVVDEGEDDDEDDDNGGSEDDDSDSEGDDDDEDGKDEQFDDDDDKADRIYTRPSTRG